MEVVLDGLKALLIPIGKPVTDKATAEGRFTGLTSVSTVVPLLPPTSKVILLFADERVKLGAGMVNCNVTVEDRLPEVPLIVRGYVPDAVADPTASDKEPVFEIVAGVKDAVTPAGRPLIDRATLAVKPFKGDTVIKSLLLDPAGTVRLVACTESVKLGAGTVTWSEVDAEELAEVPMMATV